MTGVELIAAERQRQIEVEGWTPEHDDSHPAGELALAACCYAAPIRLYGCYQHVGGVNYSDPWPDSWSSDWDKRFVYGSRRKNPSNMLPNPASYSYQERLDLLVKAGALVAAEIDRLQRNHKGR